MNATNALIQLEEPLCGIARGRFREPALNVVRDWYLTVTGHRDWLWYAEIPTKYSGKCHLRLFATQQERDTWIEYRTLTDKSWPPRGVEKV